MDSINPSLLIDVTGKPLDLIDPAQMGAEILLGKHPYIRFTSGRRTRQSQAYAMAKNVSMNRNWIEQTYRDTPETRACQLWINSNPQAVTIEDIFEGFSTVLVSFTDAELAAWNHHLAGLAFDVEPTIQNADEIKSDIRALPNLNLFLEVEGGLERWHAQFNPLTT